MKFWIFAILLCTALYLSNGTTPLDSGNNGLECTRCASMAMYQDSLGFERYANKILQENNEELYNELLIWTNHSDRIGRIAGTSGDWTYQQKLDHHVTTTNLVGQNSHQPHHNPTRR